VEDLGLQVVNELGEDVYEFCFFKIANREEEV